eukprot:scaffold26769_cov152-Cylindrotheca_fusiformis.AAC.3
MPPISTRMLPATLEDGPGVAITAPNEPEVPLAPPSEPMISVLLLSVRCSMSSSMLWAAGKEASWMSSHSQAGRLAT